jgi:chemotaxis protein MotB
MAVPANLQGHEAPMQSSDEPADTQAAWEGRPANEDLLSYRVFPDAENSLRQRASAKGQWAVVWSDLMMTMFILFVVLFAYQAAHRESLSRERPSSNSFPAVAGLGARMLPVVLATPKVYDLRRLVETDEAQALRGFASVELAPDRTVRIILASDFLFDVGQAELKPRVREKLVRIAEFVRRSPNMVNVIGHTDNIPMHSARFATNWELSVSRATAVARFLIEDMRLPANRFYVSGHGEYQPLVRNTTVSTRAANRRVEIVITREMPQAVPGTVGDLL